jgi:hypothetical protein
MVTELLRTKNNLENLRKEQNERCRNLSRELDNALSSLEGDWENQDKLKILKKIVGQCIKFPLSNKFVDINEARFLASSASKICKDLELHNVEV